MAKGGGARKYVRDNRGRFAAVGATARGGRLKTAGGSRRATQTRKIQGRPGNTISKPRGLQPGAVKPKPARRTPATSRLRPGELMNANARPVNTMARFRKGESPYNRFSGHNEENLAKAEAWLKKRGRNATTYNDPNDRAIARGNLGGNNIYLNKSAQEYWSNPRRRSIEGRRSGFYSTSHPLGLLHHEIGHNKHKGGSALWYLSGSANTWNKGIVPHSEWAKSIAPAEARQQTPLGKIKLGKQKEALARRVSRYAATNPVEFVAETYAGLRTGRRYDSQVMRAYREAQGLSPRPAARRRSRLPRRSKS